MLINTVNQRFLLSLDRDIDVKELNWCDYIVDCLKRTRLMWKGEADFFNVPMLFLSVNFFNYFIYITQCHSIVLYLMRLCHIAFHCVFVYMLYFMVLNVLCHI
ncbi:hypothetical protein Hanom_Chr16g01477511 [Helianthus anomalus]